MDNDNLILEELKRINEKLEKLETMDKRLETIEEETKNNTKQFRKINKRLENIENLIDRGVYEDIVRLEERVAKLEQKQAV